MSPALAGGFLTTEPPGKPPTPRLLGEYPTHVPRMTGCNCIIFVYKTFYGLLKELQVLAMLPTILPHTSSPSKASFSSHFYDSLEHLCLFISLACIFACYFKMPLEVHLLLYLLLQTSLGLYFTLIFRALVWFGTLESQPWDGYNNVMVLKLEDICESTWHSAWSIEDIL